MFLKSQIFPPTHTNSLAILVKDKLFKLRKSDDYSDTYNHHQANLECYVEFFRLISHKLIGYDKMDTDYKNNLKIAICNLKSKIPKSEQYDELNDKKNHTMNVLKIIKDNIIGHDKKIDECIELINELTCE